MHPLNQKHSKLLSTLVMTLISQSTFSGSMGNAAINSPNYIASITAGPVWENGGETQTFYLTPEIEKTYVANKSSAALANGELFLGMQRVFNHRLDGQLGLAVAATSTAKLNGIIWDDADPQFDNYTYQYNLQHTHLAIKGKLLANMNTVVLPWVSVSAGVGFNRASHFINTPTIFEAVPNENFASNTKTTFTYTLGAGIQRPLTSHWQIGVGYEFADWGKTELDRALGQTLGTGLALNHVYTNGVLFNITYIA